MNKECRKEDRLHNDLFYFKPQNLEFKTTGVEVPRVLKVQLSALD